MREIPKSRAADFRSFQTSLSDDQRYYVVLIDSALPQPKSAEVLALLRDVQQDIQRNDFAAASDSAKKVLSLDPNNGAAYWALGYADIRRGANDQGIGELRKSVELEPQSPSGYKALASILSFLHRDDEALDTWKQMAKAIPGDTDAAGGAASILIIKKQYAEAVSILQDAVDKHPDNSQLALRLGQAFARSGEKVKAVDAMHKAAANDPPADILNSVAYEMAVYDIGLDDALRYARTAVETEEDRTAQVDLHNLTIADLQRVQRLAAYWDTLGWVEFQMGDTAESEKCLIAAWQLAQLATTGDHLGQLYEKMGNKQDAIHYYAMAIAALRAPAETMDRLQRLTGSKTGADEAVNVARVATSQERSANLPRVVSGQARAEFSFCSHARRAQSPPNSSAVLTN